MGVAKRRRRAPGLRRETEEEARSTCRSGAGPKSNVLRSRAADPSSESRSIPVYRKRRTDRRPHRSFSRAHREVVPAEARAEQRAAVRANQKPRPLSSLFCSLSRHTVVDGRCGHLAEGGDAGRSGVPTSRERAPCARPREPSRRPPPTNRPPRPPRAVSPATMCEDDPPPRRSAYDDYRGRPRDSRIWRVATLRHPSRLRRREPNERRTARGWCRYRFEPLRSGGSCASHVSSDQTQHKPSQVPLHLQPHWAFLKRTSTGHAHNDS